MNFNRMLGKLKLKAKKYGPDVMAIGGVVLMGASAVYACIKTPKAVEIIKDAKNNLEGIREVHETGVVPCDNGSADVVEVEYTDEAYRKDVAMCYLKTAGALAKNYAVPAGMFAGGAFSSLKSYGIQKGRALTFSASAAALTAKLADLKQKMTDELGADKADELYYGAKKVKDEVVTEEDGKTKKSKQENLAIETAEDLGPFSVFYDEGCTGFIKSSPQYNRKVLFDVQAMANDKLQRDGHLFVNDIYRALGVDDTPMGQLAGWLYDGDKYVDVIDFGLFEPINRRFVQFLEPVAVVCLRPRTDIVDEI